MTLNIGRRSAASLLATVFLAGATLAGCASPAAPAQASAAPTFVLVHGAFEDHSIWDGVAAGLRRAGREVIVVDLPGRAGSDDTGEGGDAPTLDRYRDALERRVAPLHAPAILVGHSFGGITISNLAEQHPEQVRTLVYLAAMLPQDGDSALVLSRADKSNAIVPGSLVLSADHRVGRMLPSDPAAQLALFCADCDAAQAGRFKESLVAEPIEPLRTPVHLSAERYGRVDKVYLATDADRVISPQAQRTMLAATPVRKVDHLQSGHSPFLRQPDAVVQALLRLDN